MKKLSDALMDVYQAASNEGFKLVDALDPMSSSVSEFSKASEAMGRVKGLEMAIELALAWEGK